ncbi:hypothetical protein, partial [Enterococcus faecium]|uniref:hypothetical protein n=1 Tax=Enterococcus faecium TaxID=1352 RepID=UPI0022DD7FBA
LGSCNVLLGMFLWLKTLYRKRAVTWPFIFYTIIWTLSDFEEAKRALFSYISSISYLTPQEFEDLTREEIA